MSESQEKFVVADGKQLLSIQCENGFILIEQLNKNTGVRSGVLMTVNNLKSIVKYVKGKL